MQTPSRPLVPLSFMLAAYTALVAQFAQRHMSLSLPNYLPPRKGKKF